MDKNLTTMDFFCGEDSYNDPENIGYLDNMVDSLGSDIKSEEDFNSVNFLSGYDHNDNDIGLGHLAEHDLEDEIKIADHRLLMNENSVGNYNSNQNDIILARLGYESNDNQLTGETDLLFSDQSESFCDNTYSGSKSFSCMQCGNTFQSKFDLSRHLEKHSEDLKPYKCKECSKSFRFSSSLLSHKRVHTGERPFSCNACGKQFRQNSVLNRHWKTVHEGKRPVECTQCHMRFIQKSDLAKHLAVHERKKVLNVYENETFEEGIISDLNEEKLMSKQQQKILKETMDDLNYNDIKYSLSDVINKEKIKSFSKKVKKKEVKKKSPVEKSYKCVDCGKSFQRNAALKRHMKQHSHPKSNAKG